MKWIKIDKRNLPKGEILCANFRPRTYGFKEKLIGYIHVVREVTTKTDKICCHSSTICLEEVTHYINIHEFDIEVDDELL